MGKSTNELPWTGERLVSGVETSIATVEHLHRYALASKLVPGRQVLDIASGEGYGSNLLAQYAEHVVGVDISADAISFASEKYKKENLEYRVGSVDQIPMDDKSVDVVVSFETIEHHTLHDEMMNEIKRVLRPNGILIISSPEKSIYSRKDPNNPFHVKELLLDEFQYLIGKYFLYSSFYEQRLVFGSLVSPLGRESNHSLGLFTGNLSEISDGLNPSLDEINQPFFNLCLASDGDLPKLDDTFFDGGFVFENIRREIGRLARETSSVSRLAIRIVKTILRPAAAYFRRRP